jgi:N-acetylglucosaminyl-diphospho-decaprenol L-rhamnosyltransferase
MPCTAIVVTYNSGAAIAACLEALAREYCEIIVVDNASADDTLARVEEFANLHPVRLLANNQNRGFGAAVNQGAKEANGDSLLILNADAIAEPGAVAAMLHCMTSTGADAVGGALLNSDGQPDRGFAFRRLPTLWALIFEATLVNQIWPGNPVNRSYRCLDADYAQQQEVEQPAGACMAVKRAAFERVGGFDEQFFPVWFEDVDFCKRLRDQGSRIFYCPDAHFRHGGAHSVRQLSFRDKQLFWYGNTLRYARKHFSSGQVFLLRLAIMKGMLLRSIGALFGAKQAPLEESLSAYWAVVSHSFENRE